jgi:hypothetical protein
MPIIETPITTSAGYRFLERYAEPVVTNTYLKVALLVLSVVTLASLALLYRAQTAALRLKPIVISVSAIGRGQVVNYDDFSKVPIERVSKYYLARWASSTMDEITRRCSVIPPSRWTSSRTSCRPAHSRG